METRLHISRPPSAKVSKACRENGKKGGRPPGSAIITQIKREARELMAAKAGLIAAEMIRLALHAKTEQVRCAACRDCLAYAWGRPIAVDFSDGGGERHVTVQVVTGVRVEVEQ